MLNKMGIKLIFKADPQLRDLKTQPGCARAGCSAKGRDLAPEFPVAAACEQWDHHDVPKSCWPWGHHSAGLGEGRTVAPRLRRFGDINGQEMSWECLKGWLQVGSKARGVLAAALSDLRRS